MKRLFLCLILVSSACAMEKELPGAESKKDGTWLSSATDEYINRPTEEGQKSNGPTWREILAEAFEIDRPKAELSRLKEMKRLRERKKKSDSGKGGCSIL